MGKFSGYLLASDFDGTLADSQGRIPEPVRDKLRYYIAEGGLFTVCTGRTKQGFHLYSPDIINAPVLVANGIMAYDFAAEKTVFCDGIGREDAGIVTALQRAFPGLCIELYSADFRSFAICPNDRTRRHFAFQFIEWTEISTVDEAAVPIVKIMLSCGAAHGGEIQRWLDRNIGAYRLKYIPSTGDYVEIIRSNTGKGIGLRKLASVLGALPDRVFAVGDGENDLEMLSAASRCFVPENGCAAARAAASHIVRSNDEGAVAHAIEMIEALYC